MLSEKPIIQNIVSTLSLALTKEEKFNLHVIANKLPNAHYRPERFSALIIRMPPPIRATALFFSTGRLVCVGTKSESESRSHLDKFVEIIRNATETNIEFKEEFKIQNMTASFKFEGLLNLEGKEKIFGNYLII